ncbi:hypothetical protein CTA1_3371 [Colletotrichum tanaceti]|uniref:Uncharacterized protein n=1 Tax=Colletotrichum tanaceti TaxID=1306861 RepID=A0A4U6WZW4_9PEZI|nr:hypothetical protein CTA1_3371 [Colletotrichum tanaceti]
MLNAVAARKCATGHSGVDPFLTGSDPGSGGDSGHGPTRTAAAIRPGDGVAAHFAAEDARVEAMAVDALLENLDAPYGRGRVDEGQGDDVIAGGDDSVKSRTAFEGLHAVPSWSLSWPTAPSRVPRWPQSQVSHTRTRADDRGDTRPRHLRRQN